MRTAGSVRELWQFFRRRAASCVGALVYRPRVPEALFTGPAEASPSPDPPFLSRREEGRLLIDLSREGEAELLLLLRKEGPVLPVSVDRALGEGADADALCLLSCAERLCREDVRPERPDPLLRLVLYRLGFGEAALLARELPAAMALRLRRHEPLSPAAGELIYTAYPFRR